MLMRNTNFSICTTWRITTCKYHLSLDFLFKGSHETVPYNNACPKHAMNKLKLIVILCFIALAYASPTNPLSSQTLPGFSFGTPFDSTYDYVNPHSCQNIHRINPNFIFELQVIVDGGTASLVLANRLSSSSHPVAVIEVGSLTNSTASTSTSPKSRGMPGVMLMFASTT